mgnify:CR=1 FL=1
MMVPIVITAIVTLLIAVPVTALIASAQCKKGIEQKIGNADDKAREIIDEALKTAEAKVTRYERRVQQKEENIDKKTDAIEKKEAYLAKREEEMRKQKEEISRLNEQRVQELERISGLTSDQAKDYLLKIVEDDVKHESAKMIKEMEHRA